MKPARRAATISLLLLSACGSGVETGSDMPAVAGPATWPQWAQGPQHMGSADAAGQSPDAVLAEVVLDPFAAQEQAASDGDLLVHYPVPLVSGDDVFAMVKAGAFSGVASWQTQEWTWKRLRWENGRLAEKWTFRSDWTPEPDGGALGWEPVHQGALVGASLYVPGAGGTLLKLDAARGTVVARINPFGTATDPAIYVAGPLTADAAGNVYYNALKLDPADPWRRDALGAWLVRIAADAGARTAPWATLIPGAPAASDPCPGQFSSAALPWPPSGDARPPAPPCGSQRPGLNVAPAVAQDGTIYTVSRAQFSSRRSFLVAVNPDLSPKWAAPLSGRFQDGCGIAAANGGVLPPNGTPGGCRSGSIAGVDPATNRPGDGRVVDQSTASPVVAPDGSVLYGAYTRYNYSRGHLMKFSAAGEFLGSYDFGWDVTPAILSHAGGYSAVVKDNHYVGTGSYCDDEALCGRDPLAGAHAITQVRGDDLAVEWSFASPSRNEWCINAPALDRNGVVLANNEDGSLYAIGPGGALRKSLFLGQALGAAYTPLSLDAQGRIYTQNAGRMIVVGAR